ncbi:MAG TPA: hypothetical protein VMC84_04175, partial [Methanocella sp.]|uniref:hypothetical protein n=1 Tax=Methanocella sp. TaxID=2052833 RepID=UPI002C1323E9
MKTIDKPKGDIGMPENRYIIDNHIGIAYKTNTIFHLCIILLMIVSMLAILSCFIAFNDHGFELICPNTMNAYASN